MTPGPATSSRRGRVAPNPATPSPPRSATRPHILDRSDLLSSPRPDPFVNVAPEPNAARIDADLAARGSLRRRLLAEREAFAASPGAAAANAALAGHLRAALAPLEPACLGVYWPLRS